MPISDKTRFPQVQSIGQVNQVIDRPPEQSFTGSVVDLIRRVEKGMQESTKNNMAQLNGMLFPDTQLKALTPEESKAGAQRFKAAGITDPRVAQRLRLGENALMPPYEPPTLKQIGDFLTRPVSPVAETILNTAKQSYQNIKDFFNEPTVWKGLNVTLADPIRLAFSPIAGLFTAAGEVPLGEVGEVPLNPIGALGKVLELEDEIVDFGMGPIEGEDEFIGSLKRDFLAPAIKDILAVATFQKATGLGGDIVGKIKYGDITYTPTEARTVLGKLKTGETLTPKEKGIAEALNIAAQNIAKDPGKVAKDLEALGGAEVIEITGKAKRKTLKEIREAGEGKVSTETALIEAGEQWREMTNQPLSPIIIDVIKAFPKASGTIIKKINETYIGFKEGRLVGLKGLEGGEVRPGIEKAASLPEVSLYKSFVTETGGDDLAAIEKMKTGPYKLELYHATSRLGDKGITDMWFDISEGGYADEIISYGDTDAEMGKYHVDVDNLLVAEDTQDAIIKLFGEDRGKYPQILKDIIDDTAIPDVEVVLGDEMIMKVDRKLTNQARKKGYDAIFFKERGHGGTELVLLNPDKAKLVSIRRDDLTWPDLKLPDTNLKTGRNIGIGGEKKLTPQELYERGKQSERFKVPTDAEYAFSKIQEYLPKDGIIKNVEPTDKIIRDRINDQLAPSGVDALTGTLYVNRKEFAADIERLFDKGIKSVVTGKVIKQKLGETREATIDRYVQDLVKYETTIAQNTTPEDIQNLKYGNKALRAKTSKAIDERVVQQFSEEMTIPPDMEDLKVSGEFTTRNIKLTSEFRNFVDYAETIQMNDINEGFPVKGRHTSMTAERVAEKLDGQINGRIFQEMIQPVYDARVQIIQDLSEIYKDINVFKIIEGSNLDKEAFMVAEGKIKPKNPKAKEFAEYARGLYEALLDRLNETRDILNLEAIPRRKDYVTHVRELNLLTQTLGNYERISRARAIRMVKARLVSEGVDPILAFQRAKRQIEGSQGIEMYVDARQPIAKFIKERLGDESQQSLVGALQAYIEPAMEYIHKAEATQKNKAFKDALPLNAKNFMRQWNTEQVAGRAPGKTFRELDARIIGKIRNTLGANSIVGNMGTVVMQLTSWPQVAASAGAYNTALGISQRLQEIVTGNVGLFEYSRTRITRDMANDIGLGDSILDSIIDGIGKYTGTTDAAAKARHAINLGKQYLTGIMAAADRFTVGATWYAFYHKATNRGMLPDNAMTYADIMTGKTQANYFKEATPPILNTDWGRIMGQFGTYSFNQWEFLRKDLGKEFIKDDEFKSKKDYKTVLKSAMAFVAAAYLIDALTEKIMKRTPFEIKPLIDKMLDYATGDATLTDVRRQFQSTVANYIPFWSSARYDSAPPVKQLYDTMVDYLAGSEDAKEKAKEDLIYKYPWQLLMPYAGGQARKTLEAVETNMDIDLPFIQDRTKTAGGNKRFDLDNWYDQVSSFLFGVYATGAGQAYFDSIDKKGKKSKKKGGRF